MPSFDIIHVTGLAYKKTWAERQYLFRMAMLPFLVKLGCFTLMASYVPDEMMFLPVVVLLPSLFFEGWLLTHWARHVMTGGAHRWPFRPSGNDKKDITELRQRSHGIMGGTLAYVLLNFLMGGYYAFLLPFFPEDMDPQTADPSIAVIGFVMMLTSVLLFRFLWVYVPLSVNAPLNKILGKLQPIGLTFKMIGIWLICVVPAVLVLQLFGEGVTLIAGDINGGALVDTGFMVFRLVIDMVKNLICTAAMAYMFMILLKEK